MTDTQTAKLDQAISWLQSYAEEHELSNAALGAQLRLSAGMVSKIRNRKPEALTAATWERLSEFRASVEAQGANPGARFVMTSVAQQIQSFAEAVRAINTGDGNGGVIHGPSGIGKTTALRHYQQAKPRSTYYVRARGRGYSPNALLCDLARSLGNPIAGSLQYAPRHAKEDHVLEALNRHHLVIVDQAHEMGSDCVSAIMALMDMSGCAFVLAGTARLYDLLCSPYVDQPEQLLSRCRLRLELTPDRSGDVMPRADLELIVRDWAPELSDACVDWLHAETNKLGLLRDALSALQVALMSHEPASVSPETLASCIAITHNTYTRARVANWRR